MNPKAYAQMLHRRFEDSKSVMEALQIPLYGEGHSACRMESFVMAMQVKHSNISV